MTIFTEPSKVNPIFTDPVLAEATWEDINEATWSDLDEATWSNLNKIYGKKIAHPTFAEPTKASPTFTEPSKE